jgi:hypothetical protein
MGAMAGMLLLHLLPWEAIMILEQLLFLLLLLLPTTEHMTLDRRFQSMDMLQKIKLLSPTTEMMLLSKLQLETYLSSLVTVRILLLLPMATTIKREDIKDPYVVLHAMHVLLRSK